MLRLWRLVVEKGRMQASGGPPAGQPGSAPGVTPLKLTRPCPSFPEFGPSPKLFLRRSSLCPALPLVCLGLLHR